MKTKMLICAFMAIALYGSPASACDLKNFALEKDFKDVYRDVGIDSEFDGLSGNFEVPLRGKDLCPGRIPENAKATLVFMDNTLVQVKIEHLGGTGQLLDFAEKNYTHTQHKKNMDKATGKTARYFWPDAGKHLVTYSLTMEGNTPKEYLEITSAKHKDLFEQSYQEQDN